MADGKIELRISRDDADVAYVSLPDHPGEDTGGIVEKTVRLLDLIDYKGPDLYIDFDKENRLIGVEILA
jgi:uncharacterized protein YuzE